MQKHLSVYDFFALLVPGIILVTVLYAGAVGVTTLQFPPAWLGGIGLSALGVIGLYMLGHLVEGFDESYAWKFWRRKPVRPSDKRKMSDWQLDPEGPLGSEFVNSLFSSLNSAFGTTMNPASARDRQAAFSLCQGVLQQHGDPNRSFLMQTLYRLCKSLHTIAKVGVIVSLVVVAYQMGSFFVGRGDLDAVTFQIFAPFSSGVLALAVVGFVTSLYAMARFDEKAGKYDEYFVGSVVKSCGAWLAFAKGGNGR